MLCMFYVMLEVISSKAVKFVYWFWILNFRLIHGHLFASCWTTKVPGVLCLSLKKFSTDVNEVARCSEVSLWCCSAGCQIAGTTGKQGSCHKEKQFLVCKVLKYLSQVVLHTCRAENIIRMVTGHNDRQCFIFQEISCILLLGPSTGYLVHD